jgi:hypothetical protein
MIDANKRYWASIGVTCVVLGLYSLVIYGVVPTPVEDLKETLKLSVVAVISYWIGSSSGSAAKDIATNATSALATRAANTLTSQVLGARRDEPGDRAG